MLGGDFEEISNQLFPAIPTDGFRMELYAELRARLVSHGHHDAIGCQRSNRQASRQRIPVDAEGVVAHHIEMIRDVAEQFAPIVRDPRYPAVHGNRCRHHPCAVDVSETLMT